ncbi:hypothetical protein HPP92_020475 [Vanilla planifolia]|nr:hypothetical protein HPP92_020475 [Vanilla planifolia]
MLEAQIHGTNHLRERPPPLHVVNMKYLPEAQMPGWGDNVPNLAEWKALDKISEEGLNVNSRILPLKDLNGTVIPTSEVVADERLDENHSVVRTRTNNFPKREIKLDGKKMVADGVDASKGEYTDDVDDWHPAVSRSTNRRYMKRKARREARLAAEDSEQPVEEMGMTSTNNNDGANSRDGQDSADFAHHEVFECVHFEHESLENDEKEGNDYDGKNISSMFEKLTMNVDKFDVREQENTLGISNMELKHDQSSNKEDDFDDVCICLEDDKDICERNSDNLDVSSNGDGSFSTSFTDDSCSEQSGMLHSLSDSTVACITSDYAMQNVILQIGLRVLAPGGMQIRKMHRWVLRCHACNSVTQEIGKIFCPKCGNGGTLRKVSVTVDENGIVLASRRQRIILRGTKYSIPLPQGGRDAITKNLILREDQLPRKLLYPKIKKKPNNKDDEFLCSDDIFSSVSEKRAPLKPPVGRTIALFSGKRNPNDNFFSRKH